MIGQIVKVKKDQFLPADIILLKSSEGEHCFVETKNLDGETNLKKKKIAQIPIGEEEISQFLQKNTIKINYEPPNPLIYIFKGILLFNKKERIPLTNDNILLRGSQIKNSEFVIGVVCYNGHNTKVMMNSIKSR